jgi:serine O-acetyltransferase
MSAAPGPMASWRADLRASIETDADQRRPVGRLEVMMRVLLTTRVQAVMLFRLAQWLHGLAPPLAVVVKYVNNVVTGADIASEARIGPGLRLFHPAGVVIGPDVTLGARCVVMQGVTLGHGRGGSPVVGDGVFIGPGAKVFGGVELGDECLVGANAVVTESIPAGFLAFGIPAKPVRQVRGS